MPACQPASWSSQQALNTLDMLVRMEVRMATLVAEAEMHRAHLESSAGILGQQQQLEEAARKQVCYI